jgi:predicted short-subunit dehydrogenase-like oxidoreductase (DUF2520 family)
MASAHRRRKPTAGEHFPSNVSLIGTGSVGSTLGLLLFKKGFTIVSLVNRSAKRALALARKVQCKKVSTSVADVAPDTELLIFAVPDDALPTVVAQTAKQARLRKPLVLHTSGVHSIDVLKPFARKGCLIGSLHPIQSFPLSQSPKELLNNVKGIHFGIEGEGKVLNHIQHLVHTLGGRSVCVPGGMKPLYHAMCVFASNYVVPVLNAVSETALPLDLGSMWKEIVLPLFTTTVENAMKTSPALALTGPIVRNDFHAVAQHLDALQKFAPQLIPLYTVLGIETARIARQNGRLTSKQFTEVVGLMRTWIKKFHVDQYKENH